jgi:Universal stress protein UspA and related nucleotide-binding proteins
MKKTILVPIDISDIEFTQRITEYVNSEALIDSVQIHFLTVIPYLPYYTSLSMAYNTALPTMDELIAKSMMQLKEISKQFTVPEDRVFFHVEQGAPKDKILDMAKSLRVDLIIMASHRPDITTYLLGSNAAAVVRHAECPVLVVR